ncbi:MAG TPA: hypothetical protein VES91_09200 [Burkholderiaceae bacterium]|nr:hypothetical protein [Burkholderiaceae bacterium]
MQTTIRVFSFSAAVLLSACATTRMDAQWTNPEYQGRNVRGASVLVACEAQDLTLQRICEDQLAAAVSARGAKPTLNSQLSAAASPPTGTDPYLAAAKRVGARAIVRMTLSSGQPVAVDSGPSIGIGIGGGSGRYGGGGVGGGVGVGFPIGGARVSQAYGAETALIDPSNGATMWSGRASSSSAQNVTAQITELAQTTVGALQSTGLL